MAGRKDLFRNAAKARGLSAGYASGASEASDIVNGIRFSTTCKLHATKCKPHRELAQEDVVSKVSHSMIVNFIGLWSRPAVQNRKTVPPGLFSIP